MHSSLYQIGVCIIAYACMQILSCSSFVDGSSTGDIITGEWARARLLALRPEELRCIEYLFKWAPPSDLRSPNITAEFLVENVQLALLARFVETFMPHVRSLPNASMAAEAGINTICWQLTKPAIVFKAAPNCEINSYAPTTTIQQKYSSCTGLAVYVALALRSIGIPARVVGVPHWNKCNAPPGEERNCTACPHGDTCTPGDKSSDDACGNHDWAEVFIDGAWHFIDPEGSKTLDDGWFVDNTKLQTAHTSAYLNHSILASSWASSEWLLANEPEYYRDSSAIDYFPMVWAWSDHSVQGFDVTQRYLKGLSHQD